MYQKNNLWEASEENWLSARAVQNVFSRLISVLICRGLVFCRFAESWIHCKDKIMDSLLVLRNLESQQYIGGSSLLTW